MAESDPNMSMTARVAFACLILFAAGIGGLRLLSGPPRAGVVIGFQTGIDPGKLAQADGRYDRAIAVPITWRKFDSGTELIAALAAGEVDIADLGSSPLAIAATRSLPITTIVLASRLGRTEALAVRNAAHVARPADLAGKRIAVPFFSTCHYSLLAALAHWHIPESAVRIINLSPPQIAAAWARGDIDAAYVWDPALGALKRDGTILAGSDEVARWGAPTYDAWVARRDFIRARSDVVQAFVTVSLDAVRDWRRRRAQLDAGSPEIRAVAALTGARTADVPGLLANNDYPDAAQQAGPGGLGGGLGGGSLGGGLARDLAATARFLQGQGKVDRVLPDYRPYVDARFVRAALERPKR